MLVNLRTAALVAALSMNVLPALAHQGENHESAPQTADGTGVVTAMDNSGGTVTIKHGPIAALKWPAMTMKFKVAGPALLTGATVGEKVGFTLMNDNGKPVVSELHLLK